MIFCRNLIYNYISELKDVMGETKQGEAQLYEDVAAVPAEAADTYDDDDEDANQLNMIFNNEEYNNCENMFQEHCYCRQENTTEEAENAADNDVIVDNDDDDNYDDSQLDTIFNCDENNKCDDLFEEHSYCSCTHEKALSESVSNILNEHDYSSKLPSEIHEMHKAFDKALTDFLETPQQSIAIDTCNKIAGDEKTLT